MSGQLIGHVLRGSTTGFVCGTRINKLDVPEFGAFVEVPINNGDKQATRIIGLIHGIHIDDDPLVRQLILADNVTEQTQQDQRVNRMVPVEVSILNVGYVHDSDNRLVIRQSLPPRPPMSLAKVYKCTPQTTRAFCGHAFDFFRLVLNAPEIPTDELLAAGLCLVAGSIGNRDQRRVFLVSAGRELAKLLSQDLARLENILKRIKSVT